MNLKLNMRETTFEDLERYIVALEEARDEAQKKAKVYDEQISVIQTILNSRKNVAPQHLVDSDSPPTISMATDIAGEKSIKKAVLSLLQGNPGRRFRSSEMADILLKRGFVTESSTFVQSIFIALFRLAKKGKIKSHTEVSPTGVKTTYFWMQ